MLRDRHPFLWRSGTEQREKEVSKGIPPLGTAPKQGTAPSLSEDWLGGVGGLCEAEEMQHRCLSRPRIFWLTSFDAAQGEQLRLPADETLKRRDGAVLLQLGRKRRGLISFLHSIKLQQASFSFAPFSKEARDHE